MLELLHFLPLFIALAAYVAGSINSVKTNLVALVASLSGVAFGSFFHAGHAHAAMIFDPCYMYFMVAAISAFKIAKIKLAKKAAAKKAV